MDDSSIIELYWQRDEKAVEQTDRKYGGRLHALAMRILFCREDAEESVNDTYMAAWGNIPPQKPQYLFAFLAKICRFTAYGILDRKTAQKRQAEIIELSRELESCIAAPTVDDGCGEEIGELLNAFLAGLAQEKRVIFLRRYWYGDSVKEIAERYGFSESKVKISLMRTRNSLKAYLEKEQIRI